MLRDGFDFGDFLCAIGRHQLRPALRLGAHRWTLENCCLGCVRCPAEFPVGAARWRAGATAAVTSCGPLAASSAVSAEDVGGAPSLRRSATAGGCPSRVSGTTPNGTERWRLLVPSLKVGFIGLVGLFRPTVREL